MAKIVVLAEKPSVGKDIGRVLGCKKSGNGYVEGDKYIVTWGLGHLVTHADPERYGDTYKTWRMEDLPLIPDRLKLVVIRQTHKQFNTVKKLLNRSDVSKIIIATDAGREGELVARWILLMAGAKKPVERLWISSVTDKAILQGFKNLKDGKAYEPLFHAAVARAEADWIVGINGTRALTCHYNAQLSCGRVQTPTLAMVNTREEEIRNFVPKKYYGLQGRTKGIAFTWRDPKNNTRSFDLEAMEKRLSKVKGQDLKIKSVDHKEKKSYAPGLYDLTELQRDANRLYDFSAKETLNTLQKLYEHHKLVTYPRTDSRYISEDIVETLPERIKACGGKSYQALKSQVLKAGIKVNKSFVNNDKVSDHHALIPTEQVVFRNELTSREARIYDLIVKRFFAVLMPPMIYDEVLVEGGVGDETFVAKGKHVKQVGWKASYDDLSHDESDGDQLKDQHLPAYKAGDILKMDQFQLTRGETAPPSRFNEGSLLSAMENPLKYMPQADQEQVKIIKETKGIGTVATRADIIEKLFKSGLLEMKGKSVHITSKGRQLLELVPSELKSPLLTAEWETQLSKIEKGQLNKSVFIGEMKDYTKKIVKEIKASTATYRHDNMTRTKCPECGKYLLEIKGKKGKTLVCQDRECGYRKGVSRVTNARCPECHKKMEMRGEGENKQFICKCGYKEKLTAFNKRKQEKASQGNKKDYQKYLREEEKKRKEEDLANSPFAALAGLTSKDKK
jgi:DNA topoisomerase-3